MPQYMLLRPFSIVTHVPHRDFQDCCIAYDLGYWARVLSSTVIAHNAALLQTNFIIVQVMIHGASRLTMPTTVTVTVSQTNQGTNNTCSYSGRACKQVNTLTALSQWGIEAA